MVSKSTAGNTSTHIQFAFTKTIGLDFIWKIMKEIQSRTMQRYRYISLTKIWLAITTKVTSKSAQSHLNQTQCSLNQLFFLLNGSRLAV